MKLIIFKASEVKPPLGEEVFLWDYNDETKELDFLGYDKAIEMEVYERDENGNKDEEYCKQVEGELLEQGFILNIGWGSGENVHKDEYWSRTCVN